MKPRDLIMCLSVGALITLGIYTLKWLTKPRVIEAERERSRAQWITNNETWNTNNEIGFIYTNKTNTP